MADKLPLEDACEDILGKVLRGSNMTPGIIEFLSGVPENKIEAALDGEVDECALRGIAPVMGLDAASMLRIARDEYPKLSGDIDGLKQFNTPFDDMTVNHYLVWKGSEAVMFDTGANADKALAFLADHSLELKAVFLTHTHLDHIADLEKVKKAYPDAKVRIGAYEPYEGAEKLFPGESFSVAGITVATAKASGHSPAATVYQIDGLSNPVAIVGDVVFAGSMGGPLISYDAALSDARSAVFSLPDETVLCPGHGPMTSVSIEKENNPFFPEFKN